MNAQQFTDLAEELLALNDKYKVARKLVDLYTDAKKEGMQIVKEIAVKS